MSLDVSLRPDRKDFLSMRFFTARLEPKPLNFDPDFGLSKDKSLKDWYGEKNCYAYALGLNKGFQGTVVPGQIKRFILWEPTNALLTPQGMDTVLRSEDGLVRIFEHGADPAKKQVLAGYVCGYDFHFYRAHADGSGWSHKRGDLAPSLLDAAGRTIENPLTAQHGHADKFVGFYTVPDEGVLYRYL